MALRESKGRIISNGLPEVMADKTQLRRLLQNLIDNGIKYNKSRPVIKIDAEKIAGHWQVSVTDNGIGIEEKYREKIFAIFQRLHTREEYVGTGIGLAVCKKIVELHGGEIHVDSEEDNGTRFTFTLPEAT